MILGRTPNVHANLRTVAAVGATDSVRQEVVVTTHAFLPVTPAVEQQLIAMMMRGAASQPSNATAMARAAAQPVAPKEASICAQARSAVARKSPAAPGLVAQCNKASGRQVLAPMAAYVAPSTTTKSLGRVVAPKPPPVALVRNIVHMSAAEQAAVTANQGICNVARSAWDRKSPAFNSLIQQCFAQRKANILAGNFYVDNSSTDHDTYRAALTQAGEAIVSKNPKMQQFRATLTPGKARGFTMAMAVRSGKMADGYLEFVKPAFWPDPEAGQGFLDAMAM